MDINKINNTKQIYENDYFEWLHKQCEIISQNNSAKVEVNDENDN